VLFRSYEVTGGEIRFRGEDILALAPEERARKGKEREPVRAEDYEALHRDFAQNTYATLWAVVHEFDKE